MRRTEDIACGSRYAGSVRCIVAALKCTDLLVTLVDILEQEHVIDRSTFSTHNLCADLDDIQVFQS